jgi:hypothetical protein
VTGRTLDQGANPLAAAALSCLGISGLSAADGTFSVGGVPTNRGAVRCSAKFVRTDGKTLLGNSTAVLPVPRGATVVGDIALALDTDGGCLVDTVEIQLGLDPLNPADDKTDTDRDGLRLCDEVTYGTDPTNPDTDGDGFLDGEEIEFGSDPLDPASVPAGTGRASTEASGPPVSALNTIDPTGPNLLTEANGPAVSVFNTTDPIGPELSTEANGAAVSVLNTTDPTGPELSTEANGPAVSVLNTTDPSGPDLSTEANGPAVSVLNLTDPSGPNVAECVGPAVSVNNLGSP